MEGSLKRLRTLIKQVLKTLSLQPSPSVLWVKEPGSQVPSHQTGLPYLSLGPQLSLKALPPEIMRSLPHGLTLPVSTPMCPCTCCLSCGNSEPAVSSLNVLGAVCIWWHGRTIFPAVRGLWDTTSFGEWVSQNLPGGYPKAGLSLWLPGQLLGHTVLIGVGLQMKLWCLSVDPGKGRKHFVGLVDVSQSFSACSQLVLSLGMG